MIAVALKHQGVEGFADMARPDEAFPRLVSHLLPEGLRGLVLAGMLAALMSSLASLFNSTATLFTVDFYKRLRPASSERHLVRVGRMATIFVVLAGMAWIPFLQQLGQGQLYAYLQLVSRCSRRRSQRCSCWAYFRAVSRRFGGLVGIVAGFFVGMGRLALIVAHDNGMRFSPAFEAVAQINWLYFCFLLFAGTCALILLVSLVTPRRPAEQLEGLTYSSITPQQAAQDRAGYGFWEIFHSAVIVAITVAAYVYFW